jgi:hypothetical protein
LEGPNLSLRAASIVCGPSNDAIIFSELKAIWNGTKFANVNAGFSEICLATLDNNTVTVFRLGVTEEVFATHETNISDHSQGGDQRGFCHLSIR